MKSLMRLAAHRSFPRLLCVLASAFLVQRGEAQPTALPQPLSLCDAVQWALQNNPELAAQRQRYGIAAAEVVTARTHPFNPQLEAKVRRVIPPSGGQISNILSQEYKVLQEVELLGQRRHRQHAAEAALSRTEWEIVSREQELTVRVIRSFNTLLQRHEKLTLAQETMRMLEESLQQQRRLVEQGRLKSVDLIQSRAELEDVRAQLGMSRLALVSARQEFLRCLGIVDHPLTLRGALDPVTIKGDPAELACEALERRPDLHALRLAVEEAEARLQLTRANRFGNPVVGPALEYDDVRNTYVGAQLVLPLPAFNRKQGEIQQREAERTKAALDLQQAEVSARQDVQTAHDRLKEASNWVNTYRNQIFPNLRKGVEEVEKLLAKKDPDVDILRVLDMRRRLLKAREGYLDALGELQQARADLAAAIGDPVVALPTKPKA